MTHIDSGMSKLGLPDDAEGQKKLDDFKDKVEEVSPPNPPPMPPDSEEKKEIVNERPRTRKACVEEQRQRPEVEQAFREVEQKSAKGSKKRQRRNCLKAA